MNEALAILFLLSGGFVTLVAAIGVARLPDAFLRMHAATKAGVVGAGLILIGLGFAFGDFDTWLRVGIIVAFLLVTTPVSAHGLGLGAYLGGAPLWGGTTADHLAGVLKRHAFDEAAAQGVAPDPPGEAAPRRVLVALAGGTEAAASIEAGLLRLPEGPKEVRLLSLIDLPLLGETGPVPVGGELHAERLAERRLAAARAEAGQLAAEVGRIADGLGLGWTLHHEEGDAAALWAEAVQGADVVVGPISGWFDQGQAAAPERAVLRLAAPGALPLLLAAPGAEAPQRLLVLLEEEAGGLALLRRFLASGVDAGASLLLAATERGAGALEPAAALVRAAGRGVAVHAVPLPAEALPDVVALGAEGVVLDGMSEACRDTAAESLCRRGLRDWAPSLVLA
jgi:monovalent cation/proton antiporter MnhG/PhaG subunit